MTKKNLSIGVLGGGITGLTTAYVLKKQGVQVTVYEKKEQPGGAIRTKRIKNWLVEEGPNTLQVKSKEVWDLLTELGLQGDIVEADQKAKKRYIAKDQTPVPLPHSMGEFLTTPLLSPVGKLRLLGEPLISASTKDDESVASFIRRRLGQQPLDYGVNPFVSGIFAGDPEQLSIKHTFSSLWRLEQNHGSLVKGMFAEMKSKKRNEDTPRKALISFKKGLRQLPKAIARSLETSIKTNTTVSSISRSEDKWQVVASTNGESFEQLHDGIVSTLPTHQLSKIFQGDYFAELEDLPYAPLSVLALGFKKQHVEHPLDGFGLLIPKMEQLNTLGMLFSSTLFPHRAPKDHCLLTCFIGGARDPKAAKQPKKKLIEQVLKDMNLLLGISGDPVFSHHKFWSRAIPQYTLDYNRYLSLMKRIEDQYEGLFLAGNFRGGVSVPDCIHSGIETAKRATAYVETL